MIVESILPRPCADKQRVMGLTRGAFEPGESRHDMQNHVRYAPPLLPSSQLWPRKLVRFVFNLVSAPTLRGLSSPFDLRSRCPVWPKADPNHRSCRYPELTFIRPRAISGTDEAIEISVVVAPTTGQASVRIGWIPYANRQGAE